jgi:hypothetical protein
MYEARNRALFEEKKKMIAGEKATLAQLKGEQDKERKAFAAEKTQMARRLAELEKTTAALQKDIVRMRNEEARPFSHPNRNDFARS